MKRISLNLAGAAVLCLAAAAAANAQPASPAQSEQAKGAPATAADVKAGASVRDADGAPVGTIVSGTAQSVVVDTGQTKIGVPLSFFKKDDRGLLLSITAKQFSDAIAKAHARAQAQQQPQQPPQESH